jgi:hypothetical protein
MAAATKAAIATPSPLIAVPLAIDQLRPELRKRRHKSVSGRNSQGFSLVSGGTVARG